MHRLLFIIWICCSVSLAQAQLAEDSTAQGEDSVLTNEMLVTVEPLILDTPEIFKTYNAPGMGPLYDRELIPGRVSNDISDKFIYPRNDRSQESWLFAVFIFQLLLLVTIRLVFDKDLFAQLRAFFNLNLSQQLHRESETTIPFSTLLLNLNGFVSLAVLVYLLLLRYHLLPQNSEGQFFLIISAATTLLLTAKYLAMKLSSFIFPIDEELDLYNFNFFLNHQLLGMILIPLNMIIAYGQFRAPFITLIVALCLVGLSYILLAVKGLTIGGQYFRLYKFHFIIYICTLEIAPILVLYKVLTQVF